MTAATVDPAAGLVTLINVHHCRPEDQARLVALLLEAADTAYRHLPGFVSASIHKSADGARVTNYAQYRTPADVAAIRSDSRVSAFIRRISDSGLVAGFEGHAYEVVGVVAAAPLGQTPG